MANALADAVAREERHPGHGRPVLVGFSGGLDSTVLLHLLASSEATRAAGLRALHVHHGLHAEEVPWHALESWQDQALAALRGEGPLATALQWNVGAYLWLGDQFPTLESALAQAGALLTARSGERLRRVLAD